MQQRRYIQGNPVLGSMSLAERKKQIQDSISYLGKCLKGEIPYVGSTLIMQRNLQTHKENLKKLRRVPS